LVVRARAGAADISGSSLSTWLAVYLPAIRRYLVSVKHLRTDQAEEVIQAFVTEKLLERGLLVHADRTRGKLRNLLVRALENFLIDLRRQEPWSRRLSFEETYVHHAAGRVEIGGPLEAFEAHWGRSVVTEAVSRLYLHCEKHHRMDLWQVFEGRILSPAADGVPPVPYKQLVKRFAFASPAQAANAAFAAKRIFSRKLLEVLSEHAGPNPDLNEELADLRKILARRSKSATSRS
jgi:hypothetical protein